MSNKGLVSKIYKELKTQQQRKQTNYKSGRDLTDISAEYIQLVQEKMFHNINQEGNANIRSGARHGGSCL